MKDLKDLILIENRETETLILLNKKDIYNETFYIKTNTAPLTLINFSYIAYNLYSISMDLIGEEMMDVLNVIDSNNLFNYNKLSEDDVDILIYLSNFKQCNLDNYEQYIHNQTDFNIVLNDLRKIELIITAYNSSSFFHDIHHDKKLKEYYGNEHGSIKYYRDEHNRRINIYTPTHFVYKFYKNGEVDCYCKVNKDTVNTNFTPCSLTQEIEQLIDKCILENRYTETFNTIFGEYGTFKETKVLTFYKNKKQLDKNDALYPSCMGQ